MAAGFGSVAGIGAIRPSGRCSAYRSHPGLKVGYRLWSRRSSAAVVRQGTATCGHSALRSIAVIGRRSSDTQSINHLVHVREDSRDFGPAQARWMALAIEKDKASNPTAKSPRRAGVVVLDLDCVADSGKQRDGRKRPNSTRRCRATHLVSRHAAKVLPFST